MKYSCNLAAQVVIIMFDSYLVMESVQMSLKFFLDVLYRADTDWLVSFKAL